MKKVLFIFCLIGTISMSAKVTYVRTRGGLFGYKYVNQTTFNNGDSNVNCSNPGWTWCRITPVNITLPDGGTVVLNENLQSVFDEIITKNITETTHSGKFIYDNKLFVRYSYNVNEDSLVVNIMTLEEAKAEGNNF
ncbi:MAG: hypothetical protein JSU07_03135 [Bacteroidetes bacterium]|nr:hypothetical protein [Bacteroidota bacterium]